MNPATFRRACGPALARRFLSFVHANRSDRISPDGRDRARGDRAAAAVRRWGARGRRWRRFHDRSRPGQCADAGDRHPRHVVLHHESEPDASRPLQSRPEIDHRHGAERHAVAALRAGRPGCERRSISCGRWSSKSRALRQHPRSPRCRSRNSTLDRRHFVGQPRGCPHRFRVPASGRFLSLE